MGIKSKKIKKRFPYNEISFRASGWMLVFYFGVIKYIKETYKIKNLNLTGSSGGAVSACLLLCDVDIDDIIKILDMNRSNNTIHMFNLCNYVKTNIEVYTSKISNNKLKNNKLNIACTKITTNIDKFGYNTYFFNNNHFNTITDISNYLKASCHIPIFGGIIPFYYNDHFLYDSILTNSHPHITEKPLKISWSNGCECGCDNIKDVIRPSFNIPLSFCLDIPDRMISDLYKHGYYQAKLFFENIQENENIEIINKIKTKLKIYDENLNKIKNNIKHTIIFISFFSLIFTLNKSGKTITSNIFRVYNSIRSCI